MSPANIESVDNPLSCIILVLMRPEIRCNRWPLFFVTCSI